MWLPDQLTALTLLMLLLCPACLIISMHLNTQFSLDIDPELMEEKVSSAPLWVIILAVLAGVLLLGLIVLILWKVGFLSTPFIYIPRPLLLPLYCSDHFSTSDGPSDDAHFADVLSPYTSL